MQLQKAYEFEDKPSIVDVVHSIAKPVRCLCLTVIHILAEERNEKNLDPCSWRGLSHFGDRQFLIHLPAAE